MKLADMIAVQTPNLLYRTDLGVVRKLQEGFEAMGIFDRVTVMVHQAVAAPSINQAIPLTELHPLPTLEDPPLEYSLEMGGNRHNCAALRRAMISRGVEDVLREMAEQGGTQFAPLRVPKVAEILSVFLKNLFI